MYVIETGDTARSMADVVNRMTALAWKLVEKREDRKAG